MKRMKLPNGFGSVVIYNDKNRRRPYVVKKTINGKQKVIGYTATYEEGLAMLIQYKNDPSLFNPETISFAEVYQLMSAERYPKLAKNTIANYEAAYKHCTPLYDKPFVKLDVTDFQSIIRTMGEAGIGYASQKKARQLFHHLYTYARKYGIVAQTVDIAQFVEIDPKVLVYDKKPFNTRQINRVKAIADSQDNPLAPWAMAVMIMIYGGPRTSELCSIVKTDVKLRQRYYVIRKSKTDAGKNRPVPISRKVLPYIQTWMERPGKTLLAKADGRALSYHQFRTMFDKVMKEARCKHTPHECRHTCATLLDNAGANDTAVKRILGHATPGVTKGVYTHKSLHELKRAIDLI